jgi:hypothetical protein
MREPVEMRSDAPQAKPQHAFVGRRDVADGQQPTASSVGTTTRPFGLPYALASIEALAVHGRTREDHFEGETECETIAAVNTSADVLEDVVAASVLLPVPVRKSSGRSRISRGTQPMAVQPACGSSCAAPVASDTTTPARQQVYD